jgi:drug/metabolite transporter (DMT)-like permease
MGLILSLQNHHWPLLKTLGQTEFIVTLLITYFYFGERLTRREYAGIALLALSVFILIAYP